MQKDCRLVFNRVQKNVISYSRIRLKNHSSSKFRFKGTKKRRIRQTIFGNKNKIPIFVSKYSSFQWSMLSMMSRCMPRKSS